MVNCNPTLRPGFDSLDSRGVTSSHPRVVGFIVRRNSGSHSLSPSQSGPSDDGSQGGATRRRDRAYFRWNIGRFVSARHFGPAIGRTDSPRPPGSTTAIRITIQRPASTGNTRPVENACRNHEVRPDDGGPLFSVRCPERHWGSPRRLFAWPKKRTVSCSHSPG